MKAWLFAGLVTGLGINNIRKGAEQVESGVNKQNGARAADGAVNVAKGMGYLVVAGLVIGSLIADAMDSE